MPTVKTLIRCLSGVLLANFIASAADDPAGAKLFQKHCAVCHDNAKPEIRVPPTSALRTLTVAGIKRALTTGVMRSQGEKLTAVEVQLIASYLGVTDPIERPANQLANPCAASTPWFAGDEAAQWTSWGGESNWRYQSAQSAALESAQVPKLKLRWAFAFPDATVVRSQPAVYRGRVFIGSHDGTIYSLDAVTGCTYWATTVNGQVRSGISIGTVKGRPLAFAGDTTGHVYGLDAATGRVLWKRRLDDHPATMVTSTPAFHDGRLYVGASSYEEVLPLTPDYVCCSFRGSVSALNAGDGSLVWKTYMIEEPSRPLGKTKRGKSAEGPSGAAVWSSPTVDPARAALYVTTGDNYSDPPTKGSDAVVALMLADGRIAWSKQLTAGDAYNSSCSSPGKYNCPDSDGPDYDFGASPALVPLAGNHRALLLGQKSGVMHAVDPDRQGEILWQTRIGKGGTLGGIQWGPGTDGKQVYVALSDIALKAKAGPGTNRTQFEPDPEKGGGLFALRVDNGERIWQTPNPGCGDRRPCSPAQSAAVTVIPGIVFSGSVDGHLRAYDTGTGAIVWDYDAAHEYKTVNGVPGKGGAFDAGGPVVVGGMLFAGSGYGQWGGMPGNVLLAFGVDK